MAKFKVGDRVRVRSWNDMAQEFGVDKGGSIRDFVSNMRCFCGQTATITALGGGDVCLNFDNSKYNGSTWGFATYMIEPLEKAKKGETNMFYIKTKIAEGVTVETELPGEIFARCPECGAEMKFDIFDIREIARKAILCDTCSRKRGERNAED